MKKVDVTLLTHAIGAVRAISEELKKTLDTVPYASFEEFKAALRAAERQLEDYGARIRDDWRGARINLCGIQSSGTGGIHAAMSNWLRAAEAKIGGAA